MTPPKKATSSKQTKLKLLYRRRSNILGSANLIKKFNDGFDPTQEGEAALMIPSLKKESAQKLADLADEFNRHVQLLDKLEGAENHWNAFLVERLSQCLNSVTLPLPNGNTQSEIKHPKSRSVVSHVVSDNVSKCANCKQAHFLFQCEQFRTLSPQQRFEVAKKHGLCINCLKGTHQAENCSSGSCKSCGKKHHSLLHLPPLSSAPGPQPGTSSNKSAEANTSQSCQMSHFVPNRVESSPPEELAVAPPPVSAEVITQPRQSTVILSTAVIKVKDADNQYVLARALLDSGSQPSFISEALCQKLCLKRTKLNSPVSGIGQSVVNVRYAVTLSLTSRFETFTAKMDSLVLQKLPQFNISQGVDIIIGAALFFDLLEHDLISLASGYPTLQKTVLGYISTVARDNTGRYVVRLPFKEEKVPMLGDSHTAALRRFQQMEKRFAVDEDLRRSYSEFMDEYERLGHMDLVLVASQFFLPHHAIQRPESTTTKTRVLADDEGQRFPLAVPVVLKDTYVDDVITGDDDHDTMAETCKQFSEMMESGGFVLRKWASNYKTVLCHIPDELWETSAELEFDRSQAVKALGLLWFPQRDVFKFKVPALPDLPAVTKRIVVSEMSQLFDPLGLLGPVVVIAKMFSQTLWAADLSWGSEISEIGADSAAWRRKYCADIERLHQLEVPRRALWNTRSQYSIHCFCDASQKGYGCYVYIVSSDELGQLHSHLLTSKSRVAPLREQPIPRLELCAALLGSQLVHNLLTNINLSAPVTFWTDSAVALHWIKSRSNTWKVFVSNRVAEIQRLTKDAPWMHVPTDLNPADHISRGMLPSQILDDKLWWHGPAFLTSPVDQWPESVVSMPTKSEIEDEMRPLVSLPLNQRILSSLSPKEIDFALKSMVRLAQSQEFPAEVCLYHRKETDKSVCVASKLPLKNLILFMDEFGLLRINGQLKNLNAPIDTRHPIMLPANHQLSWMIARSVHLQTLHSGPSLLLATMRQRFWPLRGRDLARKVVCQCVTCFRCNPTSASQIMAPLSLVRFRPARAFAYSGMDYCGPFFVRPIIERGASVKVYVALFVCLVLKAVHLEVVPDLSSVACIATIKRFVARRGRVLELHCDNATTFVGADRELRNLRKEFQQQFQSQEWADFCSGNGTVPFHPWSFSTLRRHMGSRSKII
ncbi:uncharacterized protein LOC134286509 [Aedes albopictus]|uniref:Integrase zinc-binding domain-containing protein n=1 Tax=Aedes albopictus TaxID=7160 RepID=A0ABM1Y0G4_AEDAL